MKAINYACFKLEEEKQQLKALKNDFINVIGDKFALSIRWENQQFLFVGSFSVVYTVSSTTYITSKICN